MRTIWGLMRYHWEICFVFYVPPLRNGAANAHCADSMLMWVKQESACRKVAFVAAALISPSFLLLTSNLILSHKLLDQDRYHRIRPNPKKQRSNIRERLPGFRSSDRVPETPPTCHAHPRTDEVSSSWGLLSRCFDDSSPCRQRSFRSRRSQDRHPSHARKLHTANR